jgi:hypothetical protein
MRKKRKKVVDSSTVSVKKKSRTMLELTRYAGAVFHIGQWMS